jgi:hypothetical protein
MRNVMSWIKRTKEISTSIVITALIYVISDFFLGQYLNDGVAYMCRDELMHHKYCPESRRTYRMTELDDSKVIESYWNRESVRVRNAKEMKSNTDFQKYNNVIIGDSFVAQRQVLFDERVSSILNQLLGKNTAIQFGTGSWNMVTYIQALKHIEPRKGQNVHIFLMANDFYSNGYGMSNARYYRPFKDADPAEIFWAGNIETFETKAKRWLSNNSFTYQFIKFKFDAKKQKDVMRDANYLPLIELDEIQLDCGLLEKYRDMFENDKTFSLVEHAFDMSCYDQKALENLIVLRNLDSYLTQLAAKEDFSVFYYFVPSGAFRSNEGRGFKIAYGLNGKSSVTGEGMRAAIENTLNKPVFSFEELFMKHHGGPLYYSFDGHWNAGGSSVVAYKLAELINHY